MKTALNPIASLSEEQKSIFSIIQKKGPITKSDLLTLTGMKLTTLNRLMQPIEESTLIVENGIGESSGGRKPTLYNVNPKHFYLLGIDISRTYTQVILTNLKLDIIYEEQFEMNESFTPEKAVQKISDIFHTSLDSTKIGVENVLGVGLGTVGPLDRSKGIMINPYHFASDGWSNVPIRDMLFKELGLPVFIDNGANTAVLSEFLFGDGKSFRNIAYFNCGIGIRTGAISSGTIIRTINDAEDAFGHMVIDVDGESCYCGNYGCVECYSSIHSIVSNFISAKKKGRTTSVNKPMDEINYMDILNAADSSDDLAKEIITAAAVAFGTGLINYISLLNPGLVILSGPIISHSDLFYRVSTETVTKKIYLKGKNKVIFRKGGYFCDCAISIGASALVVESYLNSRILS